NGMVAEVLTLKIGAFSVARKISSTIQMKSGTVAKVMPMRTLLVWSRMAAEAALARGCTRLTVRTINIKKAKNKPGCHAPLKRLIVGGFKNMTIPSSVKTVLIANGSHLNHL